MSEDLIITEKELNSLLNNLDLKFIAQKLKIENVDKSIITLIKIVRSLQQENKQLKEDKKKAIEYINKRMVHEGEYWVRKAFHFRNTEYGKDLLQILGDKKNRGE